MIKYKKINAYAQNDIELFINDIFIHFNIFEHLKRHDLVIIKPNLLTISVNQEAVTTHPIIVESLINVIKKQYSGKIVIGDGAAASYLDMKRVFRETGYEAISKKFGIELMNFNTGSSISRNGIRLSEILAENPFIFNMAKLKTHMLTTITLAVKNVYGLVPAKYKLLYHSQNPDSASFSEFITRVFNAVNPHFSIIDGIVGMDTNGPANGRRVEPSIIAASDNAYELDHFLIDYAGVGVKNVYYMQYAVKKGYYSGHYESDSIPEPYTMKLPETNRFEGLLRFAKNRIMKRLASSYPEIVRDTCRKCMNCYNMCPAEAIIVKDGYPYVRSRKCLACYCCVEACPFDSIKTNPSLMERAIDI